MEKIAVIGIGRLGLCLALNLERIGYNVLGVDTSAQLVNAVNKKTFRSPEPLVEDYLLKARNFEAVTDLAAVVKRDIRFIFVVVPTPSLADGTFDHSYIKAVVQELMKNGKRDHTCHLVINSTTMPGFCNELKKQVEDYGYVVSYNPEFIAQGTIIENQQRPDQVLIGEANAEAGVAIENVYRRLCVNEPVFCHMDPTSAEIVKLATNCFLTTKIAFANAIGDLAQKAGADTGKVLAAIGADSRIGHKYFNYGFGYGGPCFPRDNRAFNSFAGKLNYPMLISEATDAGNNAHHHFLLEQWLEKYHEDEQIVFDSVTYKKGTDIIEESQQLRLALSLAGAGRKVKIKDEHVVIEKLKALYGNTFIYEAHGN
jgi:nucleotide sugar dehydrogenase